jgi:hypothetical protein
MSTNQIIHGTEDITVVVERGMLDGSELVFPRAGTCLLLAALLVFVTLLFVLVFFLGCYPSSSWSSPFLFIPLALPHVNFSRCCFLLRLFTGDQPKDVEATPGDIVFTVRALPHNRFTRYVHTSLSLQGYRMTP